MAKNKTKGSRRWPPLAIGQLWRVGELQLQVRHLGPSMVSYTLGKPDSVRKRSEIDGKSAVEKYLKKNLAVLMRA